MSEAEITRRIALLCGWTNLEEHDALMLPTPVWIGNPPYNAVIGKKRVVPNYTGSRDACHEFEKTISGGACEAQWTTYITHIVGPHLANDRMKFGKELREAAPRQLCRAFLKLHNQWEK